MRGALSPRDDLLESGFGGVRKAFLEVAKHRPPKRSGVCTMCPALRSSSANFVEAGRLAEGVVKQQDLGHPGRYMMRARI